MSQRRQLERDREYQRRRRAAGLAWDPQPENEERVRERKKRWYWNLTGVEYNFRLLKARRRKALERIAERRTRRAQRSA